MTKVLVSSGFGAGWSTWSGEYSALELATDSGLVELVESGAPLSQWYAYVADKWPNAYTGGLEDVHVVEVAEGEYWRITEYDGSESLEPLDLDHWNRG